MPNNSQTVAVIGAGFSGTVVTAHLLAQGTGGPARIVLVNRSGPLARGVAFGTSSSRHVLNVPAGRMSAFPADEDDFVRFAKEHDAAITGGTFAPRRLCGEYLAAVLQRAQTNRAPGASLMHVAGEAWLLPPRPTARGRQSSFAPASISRRIASSWRKGTTLPWILQAPSPRYWSQLAAAREHRSIA